jgi:DNA-binding MarR family transcriptional regulator
MSTMSATTALDRDVAAVRRFNRFYTQRIGVLRGGILASPYSLTEVRVLYEIAQQAGITATAIATALGLDPGYLSRILAGFARKRLIARTRAPDDARRSHLALTAAGRALFADLDGRQRGEVAALLGDLAPAARGRVVDGMRAIEGALAPRAEPGAIALRPPAPGDLGWIVHRHGVLYAEEYGWDARFEGLVAKSRTVARLRLLLVEPSARGTGLGTRLVDECVAFARQAGYRTITLWTNSVLRGARRIYQRAGFRLVAEEPHALFGKGLVGQTWELALR